jgi:putative membrane protein
MLLVNPVQELVRFLPVVVGIFVLGNRGDGNVWQLLGVAIPIVVGVLRFLTTRFRITETQVELQRGLLSRKVLTARLDRVRAVELTSTLIHRVLGLAKVEIGTASGATQEDDKFTLDGLPLDQARGMRAALLHRPGASAGTGPAVDGLGQPPGPGEAPADVVLLSLDPGWVRYAPLTSSGNVIAAGVVAVLAQLVQAVDVELTTAERLEQLLTGLSLALVAGGVLVGFLVLGAVFAVLGYFVTNWDYVLQRDVQGRTFHVRRGLFTSTETSLERQRVRGVELAEPLGLRLAGAARLAAVVTGLSRSERSSTQLVPPAPRDVVEGVGADLLGDSTALRVPLRQHGPAAHRRRYTRALAGSALPAGVVVLLCLLTPLPWFVVLLALVPVPFGLLLAADRYRQLGHGLTAEHLVVRSGSLRGRRAMLQRAGVIGWNVQQSWFQRRVGLATLVATTAAGQQAYAAIDIPEDQAIALADAATPGLLTPFLADTSPAPRS